MDVRSQSKAMWIPVGSDAESHMISYLEEGHSLSKALARSIRSTAGQVHALLPESADASKVLDFESGGLVPRIEEVLADGRKVDRVLPPYDELAERVAEVLRKVSPSVCLVEHFSASANDPFLKTVTTHTLVLGQEAYFALRLEDLATTLPRRFSSWHSALAAGSVRNDIFATETLSVRAVDTFAGLSKFVVIKAYDGSGFLVWSRGTNGSPSKTDSERGEPYDD